MSRFSANRSDELWDVYNGKYYRDTNDPAKELSLFGRLFNPHYVNQANSGKQEAVFKIISKTMGKGALSNLSNYIARDAEYMNDEVVVTMEDECGNIYKTKAERDKLLAEWAQDFESPTNYKNQQWKVELRQRLELERAKLQYAQEQRKLAVNEQKNLKRLNLALKEEKLCLDDGKVTDFHVYAPKDTTHIILSIGGKNHNKKCAAEATRRFMRENFESQGYRYLLAMHDDSENLHFHVILKNKNEFTGKYVQFDRADLFALRHEFAYQLDNFGIERVATLRRDRVMTLKAINSQKEQLFERQQGFGEKVEKLKNGEKNVNINILKHKKGVENQAERLLKNIDIELGYSNLNPERKRQLKEQKQDLKNFNKSLAEQEKQPADEAYIPSLKSTVKKIWSEGKRFMQKSAKLQQKPSRTGDISQRDNLQDNQLNKQQNNDSFNYEKLPKSTRKHRKNNHKKFMKFYLNEVKEAIKTLDRDHIVFCHQPDQKTTNRQAHKSLLELKKQMKLANKRRLKLGW